MRMLALLAVLTLAVSTAAVTSSGTTSAARAQAHARFQSVNGSGVGGFVHLTQRPAGGAKITVIAFGLMAGHDYVSLYYGNPTCQLEPYSASDVIGGIYTANGVGVGVTHGVADDDLDEIHSVSVRDALTFNLLACATIS